MERRRGTALVVGTAVCTAATGLGLFLSGSVASQGDVPLYSAGIALSPSGDVLLVSPGELPAFHPNSRVPVSAPAGQERRSRATAKRQQDWLSAGRIPGHGTPFEDMSRAALLDLQTLVLSNGAAVAGWSPNWRYVWPRDASFTVAALARTGHPRDAFEVLTFLQSVQQPDGNFQARYLPTGTGEVPDDRGIQLDGAGWALWGAREWFDSFGDRQPPASQLRVIAPLIRRSTVGLVGLVDPATGLPPVSSDYWERDEGTLTLGTAAPILAGLRAAPALLTALGEHDLARDARLAARRLDAGIRRTFGQGGYPRTIDGDQRDAAVAFLLPPFTERLRPDVHRAWLAAGREMRRPAGGLAPGAGWKRDGISWTPETALFALAAASSGETTMALAWTSWLERHRTSLGSLPEKVTAKGKPAAVAPLAWTASLVLLTLIELEDGAQHP